MYCTHARKRASEAHRMHFRACKIKKISEGVPPDPPHTIYSMGPAFCNCPGSAISLGGPACHHQLYMRTVSYVRYIQHCKLSKIYRRLGSCLIWSEQSCQSSEDFCQSKSLSAIIYLTATSISVRYYYLTKAFVSLILAKKFTAQLLYLHFRPMKCFKF